MSLAALIAASFFAGDALAVPALQLDIEGGDYVGGDEESTVTSASEFTLFAIGTETGNFSSDALFSDTFYLVIGLLPSPSEEGADFGSFTVDGAEYDMSDMSFGTPGEGSDSLAPHGVYDTLFLTIAFGFGSAMEIDTYNVQSDEGDPMAGSGSFAVGWDIDISGLLDGFDLHFDLYQATVDKKGNPKIGKFAPFSHDARTMTRVPAPGTLALLGLGLLVAGASRRLSLG